MSEQAGVLDGIRDIIQPTMPVLPDWSNYLLAAGFAVIIMLVLLLIFYVRRQPMVRAKKLYRQLKNSWSELQQQQRGQMIMSILRLSQGQHNLNERSYTELDITLNKQQWELLLRFSNAMRFSNANKQPMDATQVLPLIDQILWPPQ